MTSNAHALQKVVRVSQGLLTPRTELGKESPIDELVYQCIELVGTFPLSPVAAFREDVHVGVGDELAQDEPGIERQDAILGAPDDERGACDPVEPLVPQMVLGVRHQRA